MNKYQVYICLPYTGHWGVGNALDSWTAGRLMRDLARTGITCYASQENSDDLAVAVCYGVSWGYRPIIERPAGLQRFAKPAARLANV